MISKNGHLPCILKNNEEDLDFDYSGRPAGTGRNRKHSFYHSSDP